MLEDIIFNYLIPKKKKIYKRKKKLEEDRQKSIGKIKKNNKKDNFYLWKKSWGMSLATWSNYYKYCLYEKIHLENLGVFRIELILKVTKFIKKKKSLVYNLTMWNQHKLN